MPNGAAGDALHARRHRIVVVNGEQIAASRKVLRGTLDDWRAPLRCAPARQRLRGHEWAERWVLVRSPNLSVQVRCGGRMPATSRVAVAVSGDHAIELPPSEPYRVGARGCRGGRDETRARRGRSARVERACVEAWEDEPRIVVAGIPDGAWIKRRAAECWHPRRPAWRRRDPLTRG
jgi:hypothetical protein